MQIDGMGKILVFTGIIVVIIGLAFMFGGKIGLGRLPGDITINRGNFTFYFPIVTSIIISIILTIIFNLFSRR